MKKLLLTLVAAAATLFSAALYADDYPSRPITIVAVFGPGSASDTICRIIADKLSPALRQPVIVEGRPGADGALAALYVHHQPADGYTLLMGTNSPLSAVRRSRDQPSLRFRTRRQFRLAQRLGEFMRRTLNGRPLLQMVIHDRG